MTRYNTSKTPRKLGKKTPNSPKLPNKFLQSVPFPKKVCCEHLHRLFRRVKVSKLVQLETVSDLVASICPGPDSLVVLAPNCDLKLVRIHVSSYDKGWVCGYQGQCGQRLGSGTPASKRHQTFAEFVAPKFCYHKDVTIVFMIAFVCFRL